MLTGRASNVAIILVAIVAACAALIAASTVFAPMALSLFVIALVWPLQKRLELAASKSVALLACMALILVTFSFFGWLVVWAVSRAVRTILADGAKFQAIYDQGAAWIGSHGVDISALWSEHFSASWLLRAAQNLGVWFNSVMSFSVIALIYVLLGLPEVNAARSRIELLKNKEISSVLLNGSMIASTKLRRYMLVRSQMSLITGVLVFLLTYAVGLPLSKEWGVIGFALNFIPFLGPFSRRFCQRSTVRPNFNPCRRRWAFSWRSTSSSRPSGATSSPGFQDRHCRFRPSSSCCRFSSGASCGAFSAPSSACLSRSR